MEGNEQPWWSPHFYLVISIVLTVGADVVRRILDSKLGSRREYRKRIREIYQEDAEFTDEDEGDLS